MSSSIAHDQLRDEILLAVGSSGLARVWKYEVGLFRLYHSSQPVRLGMEGVTDIIGILKNGRFVGIEVKTGSGKLRESQKNFKNMIQKFGGLFIEGRSVSQVMAEIKDALSNQEQGVGIGK